MLKKQTLILLLSLACYAANAQPENSKPILAVVGTGYVGLVTGTGLAHVGHHVICSDIDKDKIDKLNHSIIPIYEPGLAPLVQENVDAQRLSFTDNVAQAIEQADVIFIAVGTPMDDDGRADMKYINAVAQTIGQHLNKHKVIITKSTVPIGTGKNIYNIISQHAPEGATFDVVSNPEFLREGVAVKDFLHPDRIVVGVSSERARNIMQTIYLPFTQQNIPLVITNIETAESIKYASNTFLAMKIAYINEIARLCDKTGADVSTIARAVGLDSRISPQFLRPGPGFGGSCFPKDVAALSHISKDIGLDLHLINTILISNQKQKDYIVDQIEHALNGSLSGKTIALLGLAFKANTDDIRETSALTIIKKLTEKGAHIRAYDPQAMANMQALFPDITYCNDPYEAATGADLVVVVTEWDEFKQMSLEEVGSRMNQRILVDTRNIIDTTKLTQLNFKYILLGKK